MCAHEISIVNVAYQIHGSCSGETSLHRCFIWGLMVCLADWHWYLLVQLGKDTFMYVIIRCHALARQKRSRKPSSNIN